MCLAGAKGLRKGLELWRVIKYPVSDVYVCAWQLVCDFNLRIFPIQYFPLTSHVPPETQFVSCWTVFTVWMSVLNFRHRYANHTGVINRSVTGIMQMNKKERRETERGKRRVWTSAKLYWHSVRGDSFVWNACIAAVIIVPLFWPHGDSPGEKVDFMSGDGQPRRSWGKSE